MPHIHLHDHMILLLCLFVSALMTDWNHNGIIIVQAYKMESDSHWVSGLRYVSAPLRIWTFWTVPNPRQPPAIFRTSVSYNLVANMQPLQTPTNPCLTSTLTSCLSNHNSGQITCNWNLAVFALISFLYFVVQWTTIQVLLEPVLPDCSLNQPQINVSLFQSSLFFWNFG